MAKGCVQQVLDGLVERYSRFKIRSRINITTKIAQYQEHYLVT